MNDVEFKQSIKDALRNSFADAEKLVQFMVEEYNKFFKEDYTNITLCLDKVSFCCGNMYLKIPLKEIKEKFPTVTITPALIKLIYESANVYCATITPCYTPKQGSDVNNGNNILDHFEISIPSIRYFSNDRELYKNSTVLMALRDSLF